MNFADFQESAIINVRGRLQAVGYLLTVTDHANKKCNKINDLIFYSVGGARERPICNGDIEIVRGNKRSYTSRPTKVHF